MNTSSTSRALAALGLRTNDPTHTVDALPKRALCALRATFVAMV